MGAGASSTINAEEFTALETELKKPADASDIATPRGQTAVAEVARLRNLMAQSSLVAKDIYDHAEDHKKRMKTQKSKLCVNVDMSSQGLEKVHSASRHALGKNLKAKLALTRRSSLERKTTFVSHSDAEETDPNQLDKEAKMQLEEIQSWVHVSYADMDCAVLVSDLSGFTSTTRKHGIVHFASIIVRMRQLCLPILHRRGAMYITTEADNFLVIFPSVLQATLAGLEMQAVIKAYEESLDQDRNKFKIRLNGVGIHCGKGVVIDKQGKLHGDVANIAYEIGEDLCSDARVLVSSAVKDAIASEESFAGAQFNVVQEGVFGVAGDVANLNFELVPVADLQYLKPSLGNLVSRHDPAVNLAELDETLKKELMQEYTALMFDFEFEEIEAKFGAQRGLVLKFKALEQVINPILKEHNGIDLEDVLWVFPDPVNAVKAVLKMKTAIEQYNLNVATEHDKITVCGYGIHSGEMIFIEDTDIHWGDPVNTSSKLGQDIAKNGELLVTSIVYEKLLADEELAKTLVFGERHLQRSGVEFLAYCINEK
jgi:class 3 adenylate cyclase